MAGLVDPQEGMAIYDPCSGSGGMLIYARSHVADNGGDPTNLVLAGQENNGTTWSIPSSGPTGTHVRMERQEARQSVIPRVARRVCGHY